LEELPTELPTNVTDLDNVTMAILNRALFDVYVVEGYLICPDTGRRFPVKDGIPNMILHEDEI
jgi:multifunctional methyltransferase subunit TRM112